MKLIYVVIKKRGESVKFVPDCELSKLFAKLAKEQTLSTGALALIRSSGYEIRCNKLIICDV